MKDKPNAVRWGLVVASWVIAGIVVGLSLAYVAWGRGGPDLGRQLVDRGVQSITICEKHHAPVWGEMRIPDSRCFWKPEKKGDCYVSYHYADAEE